MPFDETFFKPFMEVKYCGVCGVPPEYCCFGKQYLDDGGCREWIKENIVIDDSLLEDWDSTFDTITNRKGNIKIKKKNDNDGEDNVVGSDAVEGDGDSVIKEEKTKKDEKKITIIVQNRGKKRSTFTTG